MLHFRRKRSNSPSGSDANDNEDRSRKPNDTPFLQQKLEMEVPILKPKPVVWFYYLIAVLFIPMGVYLFYESESVIELRIQYDGSGTNDEYSSCKITDFNQSASCTVTFNIEKTMNPKIYVYYEIENMLQNYRSYASSRSMAQLRGEELYPDSTCDPLQDSVSGMPLNPCGLIANSFFTDIFTLESSIEMRETGIAWDVDSEARFAQPELFKKSPCSSDSCYDCITDVPLDNENPCKMTEYNGEMWAYWYPDDNKIDYLYETYPNNINPIEGVLNEHFMVWMRCARLPTFRKLYGIIEETLEANSTLEFTVDASYYVQGFGGKKSLVLSTTSDVGGSNPFIGPAYIAMGMISFILGSFFLLRRNLKPVMKLKYPQSGRQPLILEIDRHSR